MSAPSSDKAAIRQTIRALRNADHVIIGVYDGEEDIKIDNPKISEDVLIDDHLTVCDDSYLYVRLPDGTTSHVYFVLGNSPEEVICDHGISLSPVLDPLMERWEDD